MQAQQKMTTIHNLPKLGVFFGASVEKWVEYVERYRRSVLSGEGYAKDGMLEVYIRKKNKHLLLPNTV